MMAVALPLVLGLQSHCCAASWVRPETAPGSHQPTAIGWSTDFDCARQIALASNKMMLIAFHCENCAGCQWMDSEVYGHAPIIAAAQNVVALKIDGAAHPQLALRYGIKKYPTIVWTDAMGNEKHRFDGILSGYELYQAMEQHH
jgi:thiol:disulfide interchange protein